MVVDITFIEHLRKTCQMSIPKDLEAFLLEEYCEEPFPNEYTEQDLYEQIRKLEMKYHNGLLDVRLKGSEQRLKEQYETLKEEYVTAMYKMNDLEAEVTKLKGMLFGQGINLARTEEKYDF